MNIEERISDMDVDLGHVPGQSNYDGVISGEILKEGTDSTDDQSVESGQAETSEGAGDSLVESAYEHLKTIYRQNNEISEFDLQI